MTTNDIYREDNITKYLKTIHILAGTWWQDHYGRYEVDQNI